MNPPPVAQQNHLQQYHNDDSNQQQQQQQQQQQMQQPPPPQQQQQMQQPSPPPPEQQQPMQQPLPQQQPTIQPLLEPEATNDNNAIQSNNNNNNNPSTIANPMPTGHMTGSTQPPSNEQSQAQVVAASAPTTGSPQRASVTKVNLSDELNIFDWFRTTDIINQIAEKAKSSVDTVLTTLDPGMKEYLYSGGNVNIVVISDHDSMVSPIRDAFQSVFGRATVNIARYNPPEAAKAYPVRLANGFDEAIIVAQERIKKFRLDTSTVPQNQVVVVVQPSIVSVTNDEAVNSRVRNGLKLDDSLLPRWFLTYCMLIEDPVLGATMNTYSQLIPMDLDIVGAAQEAPFPQGFKNDDNLGFARSIDELMESKLELTHPGGVDGDASGKTNGKFWSVNDGERCNEWLPLWAGLDETKIMHELSLTLAHLYKRKWNDCVG